MDFVTRSDELDVAWAAGLFEGEGCFYLARCTPKGGKTYVYPRAMLNSTDKDVIERFARIVGHGNVTLDKTKKDRNPHYKLQYRWAISRPSEFEELVEIFTPYLGQRRLAKAQEVLKGGGN